MVVCPKCGSKEVLWIVYGYPSDERAKQAARGELILGGCRIAGNNPLLGCKKCHMRWLTIEEHLTKEKDKKMRVKNARKRKSGL